MCYSWEFIHRTYSREKANSNHGHDDQLQACGAASCTTKVNIHGCILTLLDLPISKRIEICRNVYESHLFLISSVVSYSMISSNLYFFEKDAGFYSFR